MEEDQVCVKCKYWMETGGADSGMVGECHRNAPRPELIDAGATSNIRYALWPVTGEKNWCGQFAERPMPAREVLARVTMIQKMEAERKSKR